MDEITNDQKIKEEVDEVISSQENAPRANQKKVNARQVASTPIQSKVNRNVASELQYRLNVYSHTGNVKPSISAPIYQDMCRRHGDIMRSISSTKWMTMDEILKAVWQLEKKMRYPSNRTRKAVDTAMGELIEREFVVIR